MANKMVEMTFAIGAALTGSFSNTFGKAGKALGELQKQSAQLQQVSGQIDGYQKMNDAITKNQAAMVEAQNQAKALEPQITSSAQKTAMLKSQYGEAQAEVERLNAVLVRNKDAYRAAQLNVQSLERQIRSSKTPNAELQKQYAAAQQEARRLGEAVKKSGAEFQQAQGKAKRLKSEMQTSASQTKSMTSQARELQAQAEKLQGGLERDREALSKLRRELSGAGVDTSRLSSEQARLTQQSQRLADAQTRLQNSRAALQATREKLSWSNVKGDLMKAAGIGLSLGAPVMQAAEFEHAAARLNAVAFSGGGRNPKKDAENFKKLQAQARQLGRDTQFTAVQAAQSQENLARAGFNANEIISAMPGLLDMAAAEGMDLATAADIMASSLRGFGLEASDAARVSNILAQTSAASNSSITGLGESLKYVAPVAKGLGISIEETNAMLGIMANAGIKGSQGGTALRAAFVRLSKEPKAVAKALGQLSIRARDAQGNFREMPELLQALSKKMKDMGSADKMKYLSNIFGSEAASGMLAVMEAAVDGTLQNLTRLNRESSGQLQALSKNTGISIDDLRAGMQNADKYARQLGVSFGDLSVYTAMLAQSSIKGADADKILTQAFSRIADKPKEVAKAMKAYGIALMDDKGKMRDFNAILTDLNNAMKDMKPPEQLQALTKIFGAEGARGVQVLMQGMGKGGLYEQYSEIAKSATGVSKEMAEKVLATFWGQKELAKSAISDLMITIGNVLLPSVEGIVKSFAEWTASLGKLASEHPEATKWIIGLVSAIASLNVGITAMKYAWLAVTYPFKSARVAVDWLRAKMLLMGETSIWSAAKTKVMTAATKAWNLVMKAGRGLLNVGKLVLYGAKTIAVSVATKAWAAAQWLWNLAMKAGRALLDVGKLVLYGAKTIAVSVATKAWAVAQGLWNIAMKAGSGLLNVGRLVLYYGKTIAISVATKAWTAAQWLWNAAMNANPIGLIVIAISGLVAAGYYLYKNWDAVSAWWGKKWEWLSNVASSAVASVRNIIASIKDWASKYFTLDFSGMFAGLKSALGSVIDTFSNLLSAVKSLFTLDFSGMWDSLKASFESFMGIFKGIGEAIRSLFNIDVSGVIDGLKAVFGGIGDMLSGIGETIAGIFTFDFSSISEGFMKFCEGAKNTLLGLGETIAGLFNIDFSGVWDSFISGFDSACSYISGKFGELTSWVGNGLSSAWNWTKGLFGYGEDAGAQEQAQEQARLKAQVQDITVLNKMSEGFTQRVAEMTAAWQPFKASLGEGFEQIYSVMQGIADRIRGVTIPAVNELASALSKIATEISSIVQAGSLEVEVKTQSTGTAESYSRTAGGTWRGRKRAEGGFINHPEIALIGEAGREAVIPLENKARGIQLWQAAGRELGLMSETNLLNSTNTRNAVSVNSVMPSMMNAMELQPQINNVIPHAAGGIFSTPHIGLVAEAGREAVIPLENKARGIPLWKAAGEEMGVSFGAPTTNNHSAPVFAPNVTITVNGGEADTERRFRQIVGEMFEDLFMDFQSRMQRVGFE